MTFPPALTNWTLADDTNIIASSPSIQDFENLINEKLAKIKEWCVLNKLSINITWKLITWLLNLWKRNQET
mgnify:CR=1 FL=1